MKKCSGTRGRGARSCVPPNASSPATEGAMEPFEYAIKKDVRNNPIVREVDQAREREQWKWFGIAGLVVVMMLVSAWQHWVLRQHGYDIVRVQEQLDAEE